MQRKYFLFGLAFLPVTKFRVIVMLSFLLFASTSIGFAIWDDTDQTFDDTILIGDGANLVVVPITESPDEDARLVPLGAFRGANDMDHYLYSFEIVFNKEGRLRVSLENSLIGEGNSFELFDAHIYYDETEIESAGNVLIIDFYEDGAFYNAEEDVFKTTIYVKIYFNSPENTETYELIRNNEVSFEVHFEAIDLFSIAD